jgi:sugar (pentulose or hexulose) kinase
VNGAGAALTWLAERDGVSEDELLSALPAWLASAREPPIFVNAVGGAPFWKPSARTELVGTSDLAGRAVAVVESVAFLVRANLEAMRAAGRPAREIVAVGGLARLDGLLARIASTCGVRVRRAGNLEATAYGAARLACPRLRPLSLETALEPDPALRASLEARYRACRERWLAA